MHEVSLAGGVLNLVEQAALREGFKRVAVLRLAVGRLACVELPALRFALTAVAPGTVLQGAVLEFDEPEGRASCLDCGEMVGMSAYGVACESCGSYRLQPTAGTELKVVDLLVSDD